MWQHRSARFGQFAALAVLALAGCAATGVTLRSNHYRLDVPPGWQVVEAGGGEGQPTVLSIPAQNGAVLVDVRLFVWSVQGPLDDPTGKALERLGASGKIVGAADTSREPCTDGNEGFTIFGEPVRAVHLVDSAGTRSVIAAGHASGSLVGIVASSVSRPPPCEVFEVMHATIAQLSRSLAPSADAARPPLRPAVLDQPAGRAGFIEIAAPDPLPR
jgi:hypothetical protein